MYLLGARYKSLLLLFFLAALAINAFGQVSVSTSTINISADQSVGGIAESFTAVPNIIISDNAAGEFGAGASRRFRLTLPSGWTFNDSAPFNVGRVGTNVTTASGALNAANTIFTVTYTATGTNADDNAITISGLEVKPNSGIAGGPFYITRTAAPTNDAVIAGFGAGFQVVALNILPGQFTRLQVLLPGQTNAPGTTNGFTGTPIAQSAGTAITTTVNAVDNYFNIVTSAPADEIAFTSNVNGIMPSPINLNSGVATANVQLNQSGTGATITATNNSNNSINAATSRAVTINALAFSKLQLILPGESANPGSATGKTGSPNNFVAGTSGQVTARAVDEYWNLVSGIGTTTTVNLSSSNASTPTITPGGGTSTLGNNGIRVFTVTYNVAGETPTLAIDNQTTPAITSYSSPSFVVVGGAYAKLQILLPGEISAPGTTTGKTGTPNSVAAGSAVTVTINAVDSKWNLVSSINNQIDLASSRNAQITSPISLVNGTASVSAILTTVGTQALSATDTNTSFTGLSSNITVTNGPYTKLLVLLPGETHNPGSATGKSGAPTNRVSGQAFQITVLSVDQNWNQVPSTGNPIAITSNDAAATLPANNTLSAAGTRNFTVTLRTSGNTSTITASDTLDPAKTPYTTSDITVVAGAATKLIVVMPGETTAFGTTAGKTGTPNPVTAGNTLTINVYALDAAGNLANSANDQVTLSATNDAYASITPSSLNLSNGAGNFTVVFRTAGTNRRLTAVDNTTGNGTMTTGQSPQFTVLVGAYTKILAVLPDQTFAPGSPTGVSGTINIPPRGTAMSIRIIAVDDNYNRVTSVTNTLTRVFISDPLATGLPANTSFATGNRTFGTANFMTAGAQSATYSDNVTGFTVVIDVPNPAGATTETDQFRSVTSGNWNSASTWESSADGITWVASTLSPTNIAATITVRSSHTVTITANLTIDQVTVESGAQVNVTGGTLIIADGADAVDFQVDGILNNRRPITTTGVLRISGTGKYQHGYTTAGGTIPTATWDTNSSCEITGITTATGNLGGTSQAFSDFVWNTPNMTTGSPSINTAFNVRNLTVLSTGSGTMNIGATGTFAVAISGTYTQNAGNVVITKTSGSRNVTIAGHFNLLGGTLAKGIGAASITFNGSTTQNFVKASSTISGALDFALNSGSTLDFGTYVLDGSTGTFNAANGSAIITANVDGLQATALSGSVQVTGTRTFGSRLYTYNGAAAQAAGDGLPTTITSLTITNANGVSLPTSTTNTYSVSGSLTINPTSGSLNLGQNILAGTFADAGLGRIITQAASAGIPSGKTWNLGIDYGGSGGQAVIAGNYKDFYTSNTGVKTTPSGTLNISGNWSTAGGHVDLLTNNTALVFNGTTQSLSDAGSNGGNGILFKDVTFNGGGVKTLATGSFALNPNGILNVNGVTNLNANGHLTLLSDAASTASIGQLTAGAQVTGNVRANRFVTGNNDIQYRTWRGISSPVSSAGNYSLAQLIDNIIITGTGGSANGFDQTAGNGQSAFTYSGSGFVEVSSTASPIPVGKGVFLTFRGDRSNFSGKTVPPFVAPENTIVDFTGTLNQGTINVPLTYSSSSTPTNLLGNPYASNISWDQLYTNNAAVLANDFLRIWNPATRSYQVTAAGSGAIISSGQGFFATIASAGTFSFTENVKVSSQPAQLLMSSPNTGFQGLQLNQQKSSASTKLMVGGNAVSNSGNPIVKMKLTYPGTANSDESVVEFRSGASANYVLSEDLDYMAATEGKLATVSSDNKWLAYNRLPQPSNVVKLAIDARVSGTYALDFQLSSFPSGTQIKLTDNYLNTSTTLSNGQTITVNIDKAVAGSFGSNRFSLSFSSLGTLPVELVDFQASKATNGVLLNWSTKSESNNDYFEVSRAGDDKIFKPLPRVAAENVASTYSLLDSKPLQGNNYYILKQVDKNGTSESFNKVVSVNFDGLATTSSFVIYPNPVVDVATFKYEGSLNDQNTIRITNTTGQVVLQKNVSAATLQNGFEINLTNYAPGLYIVELLDPKTQQRVALQKLIKR